MVRSPFFLRGASRGFTLPELIAVMVIAGVLLAVAAPKFIGSSGFDSTRLYHETIAALRYAQSSSLAMQRTVCATFTSTTLTLTYASAYGASSCDTNLVGPGGSTPPYKVTAQGSATYASFPASVNFDRVGKPTSGPTITITGFSTSIAIEAESGYVH